MGIQKMFLDHTVSTLVPATIFMLLVFNVGPLKYRNEVKSAAILYLIIGLVYNFVKDWKSMKSVSKNNRLS
jgi:sorbitol-specific phosphotransferase system component IIC